MVIKIADFGFSEKLYTKVYVRMAVDGTMRLPVKWMAPESISHGVFSEKSDVVRELSIPLPHPSIFTTPSFLSPVVIWGDLLGNLHKRYGTIPRHSLFCHPQDARPRASHGQT